MKSFLRMVDTYRPTYIGPYLVLVNLSEHKQTSVAGRRLVSQIPQCVNGNAMCNTGPNCRVRACSRSEYAQGFIISTIPQKD